MLKKSILCLILLTFIIAAALADNQHGLSLEFTYRNYPEKIPRELQNKLESASLKELFDVIVEFDKIIDSDFLYKQVQGMNKSERRSYAINTLRNFTTSYQKDVMDYLEQMEKYGKVERPSQLWLTNSIGMKATKEVVEEVIKHPSVALIWLDKRCKLPTLRDKGVAIDNGLNRRELVWNVQKINADQVWALGYTGQGIIIGHIDTGCNYNHNDLNDHMWDGSPTYPNHGWDFLGEDDNPMDPHGHGTHTAGTVAGDGTAGCSTGVAPDAQIMVLRAAPGFMSDLQNAVNFALTNGADILSMSVGWDSAGAGEAWWNTLSDQSRTLANSCIAAGVVWSVSAGSGDGMGGHYAVPYDIWIPANVPAPWYGAEGHSGVMAVGATNQNNTIASFSSLGATQWNFSPWNEYSYPPGLMKPEVVAPGGNPGIKSLSHNNPSGYAGPGGWTGTSMSCPHLTGTIALMLSKNPFLTPEEIDSIIEVTCLDLGTTGRDNTFGAGLVDALAAVNAVNEAVVADIECVPNPLTVDMGTGGRDTIVSFYCKNVGVDLLDVTNIVRSAAWIDTIYPTDFSVLPGESLAVMVTIDTTQVQRDETYEDTIWITSNDPDENPYGEVVILIVPGVADIECVPNPLTVDMGTGGRDTTVSFYCKNVGDDDLNVTNITRTAPWIDTIIPTTFSVPAAGSVQVMITIDTSTVQRDETYEDTLLITSNDPDENPYREVVILIIPGVEEETEVSETPTTPSVKCFPNPARNSASIIFTLPRTTDISIDVHDVSGRKVTTLTNGKYESGVHNISWNRKDEKGVRVPQGIYFIRLKSEVIKVSTKLIVIN